MAHRLSALDHRAFLAIEVRRAKKDARDALRFQEETASPAHAVLDPYSMQRERLIQYALVENKRRLRTNKNRDGSPSLSGERLISSTSGNHRSPAFEAIRILHCQWKEKDPDWIVKKVTDWVGSHGGWKKWLPRGVDPGAFLTDLHAKWNEVRIPRSPYLLAAGRKTLAIDPEDLWADHGTTAKVLSTVLHLVEILHTEDRRVRIHQKALAEALSKQWRPIEQTTVSSLLRSAVKNSWLREDDKYIPKRLAKLYCVARTTVGKDGLVHKGNLPPRDEDGQVRHDEDEDDEEVEFG